MFIEPIRQISKINFSVMSDDDVSKYSVLDGRTNGITLSVLNSSSRPLEDGLNSQKFGATKKTAICQTCGLGYDECPGHFGHIKLGHPIFHVGFIDIVKKILGCICIRCGKLRANYEPHINNIMKLQYDNRLKYVANLSANAKFCPYCASPLPKIDFQNKKTDLSLDFIMKFADSKIDLNAEYVNIGGDKQEGPKLNYTLNALTVYEILKKMDNKTCEILGFNPEIIRPENMIINKFPVSPTVIRPSNEEKGMTSDDQLTKNLLDIVKYNNLLINEQYKNDYSQVENYVKMIQFYAGFYYDWSNRHIPVSMLPPTDGDDKSIVGRIVGRREHKEGRIRGNIMGKRTDWTARTVVTGDTCIRPNEIGCPVHVARRLSYPEIVTEQNIKILDVMVKNGYKVYPGATAIIPRGSRNKIDLKFMKNDYILKVGDIVERNLLEGDIVWFNRQPSLHKYSTMGHHIKVINDDDYMSFRLNVGVTTPYNADFDGDEMNLIVPRSIHTKLEIDKLMNVKHNFISAQNIQPLIGCKIDSIVGPYLATHKEFKINGSVVMFLLSDLFEPIDKKFNVDINKEYTGKELFSFIIPSNINVKTNGLTIINGQMTDGYIKKSFVSDGQAESLIKTVLDIYGENEAIKFMTNLMRFANVFNMWYGFTTSIYDITYSKEQYKQYRNLIKSTIIKANIETTEVENDPNILSVDNYEQFVKRMLEVIRTNIGNQFLTSISGDKNNNLNSIITSNSGGSKVGPDSIARNTVLEGQLVIEDGRFPFTDGRRVLPYFTRDSNMPTDRGFNTHGFFVGLTWTEYIFNAMVGRKAKADEKSKTADSGALSRKMAIILEDYAVKYDLTVRDVNENIIQLFYGDNNIDPERQYIYNAGILKMNNKEIEDKYFYQNKDYIKKLIKLRDKIRKSIINVYINKMPADFPVKFCIPFNIRKINNIILMCQNEKRKETDLKEDYILAEIKNFLKHSNSAISCAIKDNLRVKDEKQMKKLFKLFLFDILAPGKLIRDYKLNKKEFDEIINILKTNIKSNIILPGESVGILAAYSISQPITQQGLRSTHASGMGGGFSLADIKQLLDISENLHNPIMTIVMNEDIRNDKNKVNLINYNIKQTSLKDLHNNIEVIFDPNRGYEKEDEIMNNFNDKENELKDSTKINWLYRIYLNKEKLLITNISLFDIMVKIDETMRNKYIQIKRGLKNKKLILSKIINYEILSNDDNSNKPIIHVRFQLKDININIFNDIIDEVLDGILIKGIANIEDSQVIERNNRFEINKDGGLEQKKENIIMTRGINNLDIRFLKGIDLTQSICNNGNDIYNLYGIEALRAYIIEILIDFIGKEANYNHISLLADYICHYGKPSGVNFHGMMKTEASIISEAALQQPMTVLQDAAAFGKSDKIYGVSSKILAGQCVPRGSCTCNIIFNTDKVMNSEFIENEEIQENNEDMDIVNQLLNADKGEDDFIPSDD